MNQYISKYRKNKQEEKLKHIRVKTQTSTGDSLTACMKIYKNTDMPERIGFLNDYKDIDIENEDDNNETFSTTIMRSYALK